MNAKEKIHFRFAEEKDLDLYYSWANDPEVRKNSFNSNAVPYADHVNWFRSKVNAPGYSFYLFLNEADVPVGQVRIHKGEKENVIGISIDEKFRGRSFATEMLLQATKDFQSANKNATITAYIKLENVASYNSFKNAGFTDEEIVIENNAKSYKLYKTVSE